MNHKVIGRVVEHSVRFGQQGFDGLSQVFEHVRRRILKRRFMVLGQDPGLKRKARRIRRDRQEVLVLRHNASTALCLLADDVAEHAALLVQKILFRALQFLRDVDGKNRQSDQLGMSMLQGCAGGLSMVFEK